MNKKYSLIILDRDGVINKKGPMHSYITSWDRFEFLPYVKEALSLLGKSSLKVVIVTNQPAISKGLISLQDLEEIHDQMRKEIVSSGGRIDKIYFCPHIAEDLCDCRKPSPKMILDAIKDFNSTLEKTVYLGDFFKDYLTAKNAGVDFIFINSKSDEQKKSLEEFRKAKITPATFSNLYGAIKFLLG